MAAEQQSLIALQANAVTEVSVTAGKTLAIGGDAEVSGMTMGKSGELVVHFNNGATLVVRNFSEVAGMGEAPAITMPNGHVVNLAQLLPTLASDIQTAAGEETPSVVTVEKPAANQDVVVKLEPGQEYQFGFAMNEPTAVKDNEGQLVITFKNGGEIIIPNYGDIKASGNPSSLTLSDGSQLKATELGDVLAQATQLAEVEPAAGEAGGGARNGFGFQSSFSATPLESLDAIGPINPTSLQYRAPDREPLPTGLNAPAPVTPNLEAADSYVYEDNSVALFVDAHPTNANEQLTITISGFDASWTVDTTASGGTYNAATGTWTITLAKGASFTGGPLVSPPADSDGDMPNLTVTLDVTNLATGMTGQAVSTINVYTDAVADTPAVAAKDATGHEDTPIALDITTAVKDTDGSEEITGVVISGVPASATLNHGTDLGGGQWLLSLTDLTGLTITTAKDYSGSFDLTVTSTATEVNLSDTEFNFNNNTANNTAKLTVTVEGVADEVLLKVEDAEVKEDGAVALKISASLTDTDGSETLTVTISGIAPGWGVDTTTSGGTYNAATGTWTLALPAGVTSFTGGPEVSPPADSDADLTGLVVTATAMDGGDTNSATAIINVVTDAVIDVPHLDAQNASGIEDNPVALTITMGVGDTDGSEQITNILISGVPAGAALNHGADLGGGVWQLTMADLTGLNFLPAPNFYGTVNLTVTITSTEANLSGGEYDYNDNQMTISDDMVITVESQPETPRVSAEEACVKEDGSVQLVVHAALDPTGPATDVLTVSISGIQADWSVDTTASGGTYDAGMGTWTLTLPAGNNFTGGPVFSPPADSDVDMTGLVVTATQTDPVSGTASSAAVTTKIVVDAVIDAPTVDAQDASGDEDTSIPLTIAVGPGGDNTDGSEAITAIIISGVPAGAALNHGTNLGGGQWSLTQADLSGLALTPAANWSGTINLTVAVTEKEVTLSGEECDLTDNQKTVTDKLTVTVKPVADEPSVSARDVCVKEDGSVQLQVSASLTDTDGSEHLTVTISGIQAGWTVNTTASGGTYNAATGVWTLTLPAGVTAFTGGPVVKPPANSDADMTGLTVTATATESDGATMSSSADFKVVTDAVIDTPFLDANNVTGDQDQPVSLDIKTNVTDTDGSEAITKIVISGVPDGFTLSAGTNLGGGQWEVTQAQLPGLQINPPAHWAGTLTLTVSSTATEVNLGGEECDLTDNQKTVTDKLTITVHARPDQPTLSVHDQCVKEDGSTQLDIQANLTDMAEYLTVTVTGFKAGWTVDTSASGGTYNAATGTWSITLATGQNFSGGPIVKPPANSDADLTGLVVTATSTEPSGVSASVQATMKVVTDAVIDTPYLNVANASGKEDVSSVSLAISTGVTDTDGSEAITKVVISGLPDGFALNKGTNLGGGAWQLTTGQLVGLKLVPPANWSGEFSLTVSSTAREVKLSGEECDYTDNEMTVTKTLKVTLTPVADAPNLCVNDVMVKEDGAVKLFVEAGLSDPSEQMTVTISGFKPGWTVDTTIDGGTYNAATGVWSITLPLGVTAFAGGPLVRPPADSDADLTGLVATVTSTETDGSTASKSGTFSIFTDAVIDAPTVDAGDVAGDAGTAIALDINVGKGGDNLDGSEQITKIELSGVPAGAVLNHGTDLGGGVWSLTLADLSGLTLTPAAGTSGSYALTVTVTETETSLSGLEFDLTDNTATASDSLTVTVRAVDPVFKVGKNVDDVDGSVTAYEVGTGTGTIKGNGAADILVGDVGGARSETQAKDYNIVMVLDISGSMGSKFDPTSKYSLLLDAVQNLLTDFSGYQGGDVKVHIVPFSTTAKTAGTFTVTDAADFAAAVNYLDTLTNAGGVTNYESALQAAITWLQGSGKIAGAETYTYFVSDGQPNTYVTSTNPAQSGSETDSMNQIKGTDGTNEIALIQSLSTEVIGVGINIGSKISNINLIDSNGVALNIDDPLDLNAALAGSNPINKINSVGGDELTGGDGNDLIFGDALFTDDLAALHGLPTDPGSGWEVFARLEAGESTTNPGWTRADTISYIKTHAAALAEESVGSDGQGRLGGHDTLSGGAGDDVLFGQEGDDILSGGDGLDTLFGGSGADTFLLGTSADGIDTIKDFSVSDGDILDISNILTGYDPLTDSLSDFVKVTANAGDTLVQIDTTGTGTAYQTVAVLEGVNVDMDTLTNHGNLIA